MLRRPLCLSAFLCLLILTLLPSRSFAASEHGLAGGTPVAKLTNQPDSWFQDNTNRSYVDNIVSWQNANGGWWKDYDASHPRPPVVATQPNGGPPGDDGGVWHRVSTIDNDATYSELRVIARAARVLGDQKYKDSFVHGLHYLEGAQYPNGGWPQRFPLQDNYGRRITFNDDAMTNVVRLMMDVADAKADFAFVSEDERKLAKTAFDKGLECILDCQIKVNGKLTVWCQQHDETTLAPAGGRAYELPSFTASESTGITMLLMDQPDPNQRIRDAVEGAVAWLDANKILGKRFARHRRPIRRRPRCDCCGRSRRPAHVGRGSTIWRPASHSSVAGTGSKKPPSIRSSTSAASDMPGTAPGATKCWPNIPHGKRIGKPTTPATHSAGN